MSLTLSRGITSHILSAVVGLAFSCSVPVHISPMQSHVSRATVPRFLRKHDMMDVSGARLSPITGHTGYMRRWDSTSNNCSCGARPHRPAFKTQKRPASVP